jgi:hypothetical protein
MRFVKQIFNFYINSSIHVALAIYSLTFITLIQLNIPYDEDLLLFVFFGSITGYNFVKYFGLAKFHHRSLANWLRVIQLFSLICFGVMCFFALKLQFNAIILLLLMALITFFYAAPLLPKELFLDNAYNLRTISGLKVYVISFVWTVVTVLLPVINNNYSIDHDVLIISFQRYLYVIILILPFDIRDLHYDSLKLGTIPQRIGISMTKKLGVFLLILFFLLEFLKDEINSDTLIISGVLTVITGVFIVFSSKHRGRNYSAFWVEGLPVFWLVLVLIFD